MMASRILQFKIGSDVVDPTARDIRSFMELEPGWHFGEGVPCVETAMRSADSLNTWAQLFGFTSRDSFPCLDGGVRLTAYEGDHYLEFTVTPNSGITMRYEVEGVELECLEDKSLQEALKFLAKKKDQICSSIDSSTFVSGTRESVAFKVWPSAQPAMRVESPRYPTNVLRRNEEQSVNISRPKATLVSA